MTSTPIYSEDSGNKIALFIRGVNVVCPIVSREVIKVFAYGLWLISLSVAM
jgi:hypothetical protein